MTHEFELKRYAVVSKLDNSIVEVHETVGEPAIALPPDCFLSEARGPDVPMLLARHKLQELEWGEAGPYLHPTIKLKVSPQAYSDLHFKEGYRSFADFMSAAAGNARKFIKENYVGYEMKGALREEVFEFLAPQIQQPLDVFEFGVYKGRSMKLWTRLFQHPENRFFGFDTFEGLPEAWISKIDGKVNYFMGEGDLKIDAPNFADDRIRLFKGLFQDTLIEFLKTYENKPKIFVIDSDLYSSAFFCLSQIHRFLQPGDYIYFDQFVDEYNEFAAFNDYVRSHYMKNRLSLVAYTNQHFAFRVVSSPA